MKPRPQEKNEPLQLCRHTEGQQPFLKPTQEIKNLLGYCLGYALQGRRVDLHVFQATLDRVQATLFDRDRKRSDFMRDFFSLSARGMNALLGREKARIWGPRDHDGATPLLDPEAVIDAMAEALAAPVEQGLVDRPKECPGLSFGPKDWGKTFVFKRPDFFFGKGMPETVTITPVPPPGFEEEGVDSLRARLRRRVNRREEIARKEREARGEKALGKKGLKRLVAVEFAKNPPKRAVREHFRTSCEDLARRAGEALRLFLQGHEEARRKMLRRRKERDFLFPPQTYWWRENSDAHCAALRDRQVYDAP